MIHRLGKTLFTREVQAITETVDEKGTLEFTINEGKTAKVKELTEAGYVVTFNATKENTTTVVTSNKLAVQESAQLKVMGKTKLSKDKPVDITNNVKLAAAPPSNTTVWMIGMPYFKKPSQKLKG